MRSRKSMKDKPYKWPKKKDKRTNNDLQNITQKIRLEQHKPPQKKTGINSAAP